MTLATEVLIDDFLILIGFVVFMFIQAMTINGIYDAFKGGCVQDLKGIKKCGGNIFYKLNPSFFERNKNKTWALPLFGCVKCMSSVYGSITFWLPVIWLFGFHPFEIFVWIIDIFSLVTLNWCIYKKL